MRNRSVRVLVAAILLILASHDIVAQAEADQLRQDAEATGTKILGRSTHRSFDIGYWEPILSVLPERDRHAQIERHCAIWAVRHRP